MNALGDIDTRWSELCANPFVPAFAQSPQWLTSLIDCSPNDATAAVRYEKDGSLLALSGLTRSRFGFIASSIDNGFLFCGNPLLDAQSASEALTGLLAAARSQLNVDAVYFKKVTHADTFDQLLAQLTQTKAIPGFARLNAHERACLEPAAGFDAWFTQNFSRKRRKEYRRLEARLADTGRLEHSQWQRGDDEQIWLDEFLKLEMSGWKGARGTALACNPLQTRHVKKAIRLAAQTGSLRFWKSSLSGEPIAMLFAFVQAGQLWLAKIAYRENLSQYSPGVMIILNATRSILDDPDIAFADSSADANHPMINNIWRDRLPTSDFLIAVPGCSHTRFQAIAAVEHMHQATRSTLKSLRDKVRGVTK